MKGLIYNPYQAGYCLVRYIPPSLANKIYKACVKAKPKAGVVLVPSLNKSWPSLWAVRPYGLKQVIAKFDLEIEREGIKLMRELEASLRAKKKAANTGRRKRRGK